MIELITASHDSAVLSKNLMASPDILTTGLTVIVGHSNVAAAYNSVQVKSPIAIYVHHDVYLPHSFFPQIKRALELVPDDWGVLGVAGVKLEDGEKEIHGNIYDRGRAWGSPWNLPAEVDTLDELLLITRGDMKFDENLPQDFYGADLCMQARIQGKKCYAISAVCYHNSSRQVGGRTPSFFESEKYFRNKYRDHLPVATTCTIIRDE